MDNRVILLVEDNEDDVALTLRALKRSNILNPVVVARDGVQAQDYLFGGEGHLENGRRVVPVIVLLDLKLPKVDGLQVLRQIRADDRSALLPVVVLTSSKEDQDIVDSYRLGANSYIRKPVSFDQFAEAVRQLGLYWLVLNEPPPTAR